MLLALWDGDRQGRTSDRLSDRELRNLTKLGASILRVDGTRSRGSYVSRSCRYQHTNGGRVPGAPRNGLLDRIVLKARRPSLPIVAIIALTRNLNQAPPLPRNVLAAAEYGR